MLQTETFPVWVEYWPEGSTHNHILLLREVNSPASAESLARLQIELEDCAGELAEAVRICSSSRHKGHGHSHPEEEVQKAFRTAAWQLLHCDYRQVWYDMQRQKARYERWNKDLPLSERKPVPEAVIVPKQGNPADWEVLLVDKDGNPYLHDVRHGVMQDLMPDPRDLGAKPNKYGPGWELPPPSLNRN